MSAYKEDGQHCDPEEVVMIYDASTATCVYAFCPNHQDEYVHPAYAFNLDYFRMKGEQIAETAKEYGRVPHASIPRSFIENKVLVSRPSLAEYLFKLEVTDEEKP